MADGLLFANVGCVSGYDEIHLASILLNVRLGRNTWSRRHDNDPAIRLVRESI
jgi:hypothetical protein